MELTIQQDVMVVVSPHITHLWIIVGVSISAFYYNFRCITSLTYATRYLQKKITHFYEKGYIQYRDNK